MSNSVHFSISGERLTDLARDLVREGQWRHALTTLVEGLHGMTHDLALAVLKGDRRLIGDDNDLQDEAEDPEVQKELQTSYNEALLGNTLTLGGQNYRAYALVTRTGSGDYCAAKERYDRNGMRKYLHHLPETPTMDQAFRIEEALNYADNIQTDIALPVVLPQEGRVYVLLARDTSAGDLPLWMTPNTRVEQLICEDTFYLPVRKYVEPPAPPPSAPVPETPVDQEAIAARRARERSRESAFDQQVKRTRERIVQFADADTEFGWHEFRYHDETRNLYHSLRAPKRALMAYALSRTAGSHLAPPYAPISEPGMKMVVDNPLHTDVWLGCGLELDEKVYDHECLEHRAFMEMMFSIQKELLGYEFQVLTSGGQSCLFGTLVGPDAKFIDDDAILLVPHAGVEFDMPARQASAVICETGGKLAHLVTVCREDNKPIVRVPDAMKILRPGMKVSLDLKSGKLSIAGF